MSDKFDYLATFLPDGVFSNPSIKRYGYRTTERHADYVNDDANSLVEIQNVSQKNPVVSFNRIKSNVKNMLFPCL